jgi:hypothetical protein
VARQVHRSGARFCRHVDLTAPYERHWTSHFAHVVWNFHVKHWKIVIGGAVALISQSIMIEDRRERTSNDLLFRVIAYCHYWT